MPIKKVAPLKKTKARVAKAVPARSKKLVTPEAPVIFPVEIFIFVSLIVFASLFLVWWSFLALNSSSSVTDPNAWIYSRHKNDESLKNGCGADPLITMPGCLPKNN